MAARYYRPPQSEIKNARSGLKGAAAGKIGINKMNSTATATLVANQPFSLGGALAVPPAIDVANQATESLQRCADQLQNQIAAVGDTKAADIPLALLFSVLKAKATIRKDVAAARRSAA